MLFVKKFKKNESIFLFRGFSILGLALIAFGTGGIKPCVVSFGAEQFQLPEQENYLSSYFSFFYASINAGTVKSRLEWLLSE